MLQLSRVSLRGPKDEPGAITDLARGDFDASIIEGEDPENLPECRILCSDIKIMGDLSSILSGIQRSGIRPDGFGEMKMRVSSEDVMGAIFEHFGIEVIDLL